MVLERQRRRVLEERLRQSFQANLVQRLQSSALAEVSHVCSTTIHQKVHGAKTLLVFCAGHHCQMLDVLSFLAGDCMLALLVMFTFML